MPKTLQQAVTLFANPMNCREYLVARRWPNGVTCPQCGSASVYFDSSRNGWECKTRHPKRKFTLKTGTIFEDSPLGLDKWLPQLQERRQLVGDSPLDRRDAKNRMVHAPADPPRHTGGRRRRDGRRRGSGRDVHRREVARPPGQFHHEGPEGPREWPEGPEPWTALVMGLLERESTEGAVRVRTHRAGSRCARRRARARRRGFVGHDGCPDVVSLPRGQLRTPVR
jgi:hypothetical protein